jgi:hypothetical protein
VHTPLALLLALVAASPARSDPATLVMYVSHHPRNADAVVLAAAIEKACAMPFLGCRLAEPLEATTFLHVEARPERPGSPVFLGLVIIKSRVMMPGSVSARDRSLEQLALDLLASVKLRQIERNGIIEVPSGDIRSPRR